MTKPKESRKQEPKAARERRIRTEKAIQIGEWIRYARTKLEWSQGRLAKELHVARSTVSSWESGDYEPAAGKLVEFGNLLPYPECLEAWGHGLVNVDKLQHWKAPPPSGMLRVPFVEMALLSQVRGDLPKALVPRSSFDALRASEP